MLAQGKRVVISGSGNVAVYTVEKLLELGAIPLTMSDSKGYVYEPDGFTTETLHALSDHKVTKRIPLTEYQTKTGAHPLHDALHTLPAYVCWIPMTWHVQNACQCIVWAAFYI